MKNTVKLFGIIALVAVIGFSMVACEPENTTKDDEILEATTAGQLTITGLSTYNGQKIYAVCGPHTLFAYERAQNRYAPNENMSGPHENFPATVSNGQAVLKVFVDINLGSFITGKGGGYQSYTGNDQNVIFDVEVGGNVIGTVTVNFSGGLGNGVFTPTPNP